MARGLGWRLGALAAVILAVACAPKPQTDQASGQAPQLVLRPATFDALPGWDSDNSAAALPALLSSCDRLTRLPPDRPVGPGVAADWQAPCAAAKALPVGDDQAMRDFLRAHFQPFQVLNNDSAQGIFTGYYEAELRGSRRQDATYDVPLYGPPGDLINADLSLFDESLKGKRVVGRVENGRFVPYLQRKDIDTGAIKDAAQPVLWVDDPIDAFILHIQGSGRVILPDGSAVRVGYAANNGHRFVGIGSVMQKRGLIPEGGLSMQSIRAWLKANPDQAAALMAENPRYIFFRLIEGAGPIGAQGAPLTAGRSMAIDPAFLPLGAPLWLDAEHPMGGARLQRLMVAQDTGSAIKGVIRGDFFWGSGEAALDFAGRMKSAGGYWVLLPLRPGLAMMPVGGHADAQASQGQES